MLAYSHTMTQRYHRFAYYRICAGWHTIDSLNEIHKNPNGGLVTDLALFVFLNRSQDVLTNFMCFIKIWISDAFLCFDFSSQIIVWFRHVHTILNIFPPNLTKWIWCLKLILQCSVYTNWILIDTRFIVINMRVVTIL